MIEEHILHVRAEVAELVDALGSGSSGRMPVGVRLSPSAPHYLFKALFHQKQRLFYFRPLPWQPQKNWLTPFPFDFSLLFFHSIRMMFQEKFKNWPSNPCRAQ